MCAMKVTILGCGAAPGVPAISNGWGACDPAEPRNRRQRASILVEEGPTRVLIDTSPDLRAQLLGANVRHLDAVLFTHAHADHIHGIDELREINRAMGRPLVAYATDETFVLLRARFGYVFEGIPQGAPFFRPWLTPSVIVPGGTFSVGSMKVTPFLQDHGRSATTIGYRLEDVVYSTDILDLPAASKPVVAGAKLWIVGAYSTAPHPTHAHVARVLDWVEELKPQRAVITHMSNAIDYQTLARTLPAHVVPAYDGLEIIA